MPRRLLLSGFVGYVRVSTSSQLDEGESLRSQTVLLEEYAREMGMAIKIVPASEPGHGPIIGRPRFREAIRTVEELGWKLLVTNPSRLSREVDHVKYVDFRKTPVWVVGEGRVSKGLLLKGVVAAQAELQQLRSGGGASAVKCAPAYRSEESKIAASVGRLAGAKANGDRAFRNRLRVQNYLERNPAAQEMTHQQLVDTLNASGIVNCVSERKQMEKPWTISSLRPVRRDANAQIALDSEPDDTFMG